MRKMASVQVIDQVIPIEGADKICQYFVNGWKVIDLVGKYKKGDSVVFCEVDSWVPNTLAPFLSKGKTPRGYKGVPGERLKTIKMKGALSQGLLLPVYHDGFGPYIMVLDDEDGEYSYTVEVGEDVSELLGIQKWEPADEFNAGNTKGNFPAFIQKTDQERVQNIYRNLEKLDHPEYFVVEEKAEGSSITCYLKLEEDQSYSFGVCSRNLELKDDGNTFFETAKKFKVEEKMRNIVAKMQHVAVLILQGELIGPGIQGNIYDLVEHEIRFFDLSAQDKEANLANNNGIEFCDPDTFHSIADEFGLLTVPVVGLMHINTLKNMQLDDILNYANATTQIGSKKHLREGVVFKLQDDCFGKAKRYSFKAISNEYLLKRGY